jgi:hypothetical protein
MKFIPSEELKACLYGIIANADCPFITTNGKYEVDAFRMNDKTVITVNEINTVGDHSLLAQIAIDSEEQFHLEFLSLDVFDILIKAGRAFRTEED